MKKRTLSGKERVQEFRTRKKKGDMRRVEIYLPMATVEKLDTLCRAKLKERWEVITELIEGETKGLGAKHGKK